MAEFHQHIIEHSEWWLTSRYENLIPIGYGTYGSVCRAFDTKLQRLVAIKKLSRPFVSSAYAKVAYRELIIMHHMDHENIVCLTDAFTPQQSRDMFNDIYLVTPWIGPDLAKFIQEDDIQSDHVQFFVYQMLRALKYIHSSGIIHRDLKPANITASNDNELKILDFGLARQVDDDMTGYVFTRWYRAPEVLLSFSHYNDRADIWSVGCIMGELLTRKPLFPGLNLLDQWAKIIGLVGNPDDEFMSKIESEGTRSIIKDNFHSALDVDFEQFFQDFTTDTDAIDLLSKMLTLDPDRRISAVDALSHPYLETYHDESDEPTAPPFVDTMESQNNVDLEQWKDIIWEMLRNFCPRMTSLDRVED